MKTVIELAREAGVRDDGHRFEFSEYKYLARFAELVRADEREACAKVAEAFGEMGLGVNSAAAAIREMS